jgi:hypothetical protein
MSATQVQAWIAVVGALVTVALGLRQFFTYRANRDYLTTVGQAFGSAVDALSDEKLTKQIAAAVLLRRFFDPNTEQGVHGLPYKSEAVNVIAGTLREDHDVRLQKALADGLRYARVLTGVDLQQCNLANAYLGKKEGDTWELDLSNADMFDANLDGASLKEVKAHKAVFYMASLKKTVFEDADISEADFRDAELSGAKFAGANIAGAKFQGAKNIPDAVAALLDAEFIGKAGAKVPKPAKAA